MKKTLIVALMVMSGTAFAQTQAKEVQKTINRAGESCHKVTQVFHSGSHNGSAMYSVACSGGQTYLLKINHNGSGSIASCRVLEKVGVKCFTKF